MPVIIMIITLRVTNLLYESSSFSSPSHGIARLILSPILIAIAIPIMTFIGFGMWNLMNYLFSVSGLIEEEKFDKGKLDTYHKKTKPIKKMGFVDVIKKTFGSVFFAIVGSLLMLMILIKGINTIFSYDDQKKHEKRQSSFQKQYKINDYNDSKILFYKRELEINSKAFVEADNDYDIFQAGTKIKLATQCIWLALNKYDESTSHQEVRKFEKNAINKYVDSESKIKQTMENEDFFKKHRHYLNDFTAPSYYRCDENLSVNSMYTHNIGNYILSQHKDLKNLQNNGDNSSKFFNKYIKPKATWFKVLQERHPDYLEKIELEIKHKKAIKQAKLLHKKRQKFLFDAIKEHRDSAFDTLLSEGGEDFKDIDKNIKILLYAVKMENEYAVKSILASKSIIISKKHLYQAFEYAVKHNNIPIINHFLSHGINLNRENHIPYLTLAFKGCKNLQMVKLLLDNGANPDLLHSNGSPRSRLKSYCPYEEPYQKMLKLLNNY